MSTEFNELLPDPHSYKMQGWIDGGCAGVNPAVIQHRDRVLRAYFQGRTWDQNHEFLLKRKLVLNSSQLLPQFPYVVDDEWQVKVGRLELGRGDLVFGDGAGHYAVVEVKWIDLEGIGRQKRTTKESNRRKRNEVRAQARRYAAILLDIWEDTEQVQAFVFTNERQRPKLIDTLEKPIQES